MEAHPERPRPAPDALRATKERIASGIGTNAPSTLLARSWERCVRAGLSPDRMSGDAPHLDGQELREAQDRVTDLAARARPIIEYLHGQIRDSGCIVLLSDENGVLLDAVGDPGFSGRAAQVALRPGASWAEADRGTNAVGTALIEAAPVVIHGEEHFLERNGFLACAAAPLTASNGKLIGVIDISCDQRVYHPHTFGLVRAAAQMIENRMFEITHVRDIKLRFHTCVQGVGTLVEGVVAVTPDGRIRGANGPAMDLLGLHRRDVGRASIAPLLDDTLESLLSRERRRGGEPVELRQGGTNRLFLRVDMPRVARPTSRSNVWPADALTAIETGDPQMARAIGQVRRAIGHSIPILVHGETGVGKDVMARAIHASGPRRGRPFVAVNCAALPESMIEAELFGYAPGAFTGARREGSPGRIREAEGGTLFLDEIGDMPLAMQTRLLRVIEERMVSPLGGRAVPVDFALISATNCDLRQAVAGGRFRADLYYRISGLGVALPPLRRRTDLDALIGQMLRRESSDSPRTIAPDLLAAFRAFTWPGNLRQLANVLRIGISLCDADETEIDWHHLPEDIAAELRTTQAPAAADTTRTGTAAVTEEAATREVLAPSLRVHADHLILRAIETAGGNMSAAARQLGISRNTLYRRVAMMSGNPSSNGA